MSHVPSLADFEDFYLGEYLKFEAEIDSTERIPDELLRRAAELGSYRLTIPVEYGGFGLAVGELLPYLEVVARGLGSGRMLVHLTNGVWRPLAQYGSEDQRRLVSGMASGENVVAFALTEETGGTGLDTKSRAVRDGDAWILSGEKHLITFADRADHFILVAATGDPGTERSLTAFLVPRDAPGFHIDASQLTMGLHGTGHAWLRYDGMRLADSQVLGEVGQGHEIGLSFLDYSRISLSACMVGMSEQALAEAVSFAKRRVTFGRPIADRQAIQSHLAMMRADVDAGRGLVQRAAGLLDAGAPFTAEAAIAKLFCLNMVGRVTDLSLRVHGGFGYTKNAAIERIYRDARGFWFEEGTQEIQQLVVARAELARSSAGSRGDRV